MTGSSGAFMSPKEKESGKEGIGDKHSKKGLHHGSSCGLPHAFGTAVHLQAGVTGNGNHDPGKDALLIMPEYRSQVSALSSARMM